MIFKCFDKLHSEEEFFLDARMVSEWMEEMVKYRDSQEEQF